MKRVVLWIAALAVLTTAGVAIFMRTLDHPIETWHADPTEVVRGQVQNDYLVAPEGASRSEPNRLFEARDISPKDLLFLFDSIAANAPRTAQIAMDEDGLTVTYVQKSMLFAFPDYISVKAVPVGEGAGLVIWSRSRFGVSDLGVNGARIDDWLVKLGE